MECNEKGDKGDKGVTGDLSGEWELETATRRYGPL
jgi:hypothetical protein